MLTLQGGGLLKGKWALVTGTSRGIGRAIAEAFAAESASLIITSEPQAKEDLEQVRLICLKLRTLKTFKAKILHE